MSNRPAERTMAVSVKHGRDTAVSARKVCKIIMACSVLHNLAIRQGVPLQEPPRPDGPMPDAVPLPLPNAAAIQTRQRIIQIF